MKNDAFNRILKRTPESTKIFVSKSLDIAERLNEILIKKGMTQNELAKELGKSPSEVSKWLSGLHNFTLKSISKIEAILGEEILITPSPKEVETKIVLFSNVIQIPNVVYTKNDDDLLIEDCPKYSKWTANEKIEEYNYHPSY